MAEQFFKTEASKYNSLLAFAKFDRIHPAYPPEVSAEMGKMAFEMHLLAGPRHGNCE